MSFESKGQYNFGSKEGYSLVSGYNKMLREKGISNEEEAKKVGVVAPRTANKQSGFFK